VQQDQGLDRDAMIGIFLITLIMGAWLIFFQPQPPPPQDPAPDVVEVPDEEAPTGPEFRAERLGAVAPPLAGFEAVTSGEERLITVETDRFRMLFSTKGATPRSVELVRYYVAGEDRRPVEMVSAENGALALAFTPPQGRYVDTRSLYFQTAFQGDRLDATQAPQELVFDAPIGEGALRYVYTFTPGSFELGFRVEEAGTDLLTASGGFEVIWDGSIPFAEADEREEAMGSGVYARSGGEIVQITLNRRQEEGQRLTGTVDWVAVKSKYFVALLQPQMATEGAELEGQRFGEPGELGYAEDFVARLLMPRPRGQAVDFSIYLGPMDPRQLERVATGTFRMVDYGFGQTLTRPIAEFVVDPLFRLLGRFLPNYGLVIILFGIIVKMALYPLTKVSYKNTARMRELQPKLEAVKEKHPDDPQKQQEAMLRVYKETGINPLAGCLPLLLQYPIIIALWRYFQNSVVIRQESFLWAQDLSAPDPILQLPFTIPLYGDFVAGFTLIMGLSMIVQMKVAMPPTTSGPQMKIFMYVLPIILFVIFNRLASGLSLYYLVFNLLTIVQQKMINSSIEKQGVAEAQPPKGKIKPAGSTNGQGGKRSRPRKPAKRT
jgi:YidC/Oxa1 family membrane protein insertase